MKPDIFIQTSTRLRRKSLKTIVKSKQRLKSAEINLKTAIETVLLYNSEIRFQVVRFKNNLDNINRF